VLVYALRRLNKEVVSVLYPNRGHGVSASSVEDIQEFMQPVEAGPPSASSQRRASVE